LIELHTLWLAVADVKVEPGVPVEISPLFALDDVEVAAKQKEGRLPAGLNVTRPQFFC
jgi:hypothetical protein